MQPGRWIGEKVLGRKIPVVAKAMERLVVSMKVGIAFRRGCWRPRPPMRIDRVEMMWAWNGRSSVLVMRVMEESRRSENCSLRSLDHRSQSSGRSDETELTTSEVKR